MSGRKTLLYWDTRVFLAWIKQEACWPEDVTRGIEQIADDWRAGNTILVTSSLTMLEILSSQLSTEQKDQFRKAFSHPRLQLIDLDRRVSIRASVIREHYDDRVFDSDGNRQSGRNIGIGDAVHLATALSVDGLLEFQTLDGSGRRKRKYDLLALGDEVAGARLRIRMPKYVQPPVLADTPDELAMKEQGNLFDQVPDTASTDP